MEEDIILTGPGSVTDRLNKLERVVAKITERVYPPTAYTTTTAGSVTVITPQSALETRIRQLEEANAELRRVAEDKDDEIERITNLYDDAVEMIEVLSEQLVSIREIANAL